MDLHRPVTSDNFIVLDEFLPTADRTVRGNRKGHGWLKKAAVEGLGSEIGPIGSGP